MKLATVKQNAGAMLAHTKHILNKKSPEIWLGVGIVCIVGGTIWACKASRKLDTIMDIHDSNIEELEIVREDTIDADKGEVELAEEDRLEEKDYKKEKARIKIETGITIAREYAPAVVLIAGGIGMVINGHRILSQRNAALLAAYTSLDEAFHKYRLAVRTKYGDAVDEEIYSGRVITKETKTEIGEDGKKIKTKQEILSIGEGVDPYAVLFDEVNTDEWNRSPDYNLNTLKCQENAFNNLLIRRHGDGRYKRGFVFLNEVYKALGFPETPTGAICGWLMPLEGEVAEGDNYISFGLDASHGEQVVRFLNGDEPNVWLHFNCQGAIWDKI